MAMRGSRNWLVGILACGLVLGIGDAAMAHPTQRAEPPVVSEAALDSVFLVGVALPDGSFEEVGTAWTIADNYLATNAHVAEGLLELAGSGGRMVARRGVLDQNEVVIGNIVLHPAYTSWNQRLSRMLVGSASQLKEFNVIAVADVAVMEVVAGDAGRPLPCCDVADPSHEPRLGSDIIYVGYPAENLSGFATAHVVRGNITAKTDFFFMRTAWPEAHLLHFAGPATGGASGSPVLDSEGRVVGILSAAEHLQVDESTRISFGFAYAQRVDLALELLDGSVERKQAERNRQWLDRSLDLFVKPEALVDQIIRAHSQFVAVDASNYQLVTQRQDTLTTDSTERSLRVVIEPGYLYGFIAVAHDASDIDLFINGADGTVLGKDEAIDQFPVVWIDPLAARTEVTMVLRAAEALIQPTPVTARAVRVPASLLATAPATNDPAANPDMVRIHTQTINVDQDGAHNYEMTIQAEPGVRYICNANSPAMHDVDLRLFKDGVVLAEDVLTDWYPRVIVEGQAGELKLEIILPASIRIGDIVELTIDTLPVGEG